jgi:hypothetical protein
MPAIYRAVPTNGQAPRPLSRDAACCDPVSTNGCGVVSGLGVEAMSACPGASQSSTDHAAVAGRP